MKTLILQSPGVMEYIDSVKPMMKEGFSMLRVKRIGVCGTDIHAYEGTQPYFEYPRVLGHELALEFIEGDAEGFKKGEHVTCMPYFYCGACAACRKGHTNCCSNLKVFGVHQHGGMSEFVIVPSYSLLHAEGLSDDELAWIEPLAVAAHGIDRAKVQPGETVLVIGAGPIGVGLMEMAHVAKANVIAMDVSDQRLDFCRDKLGVKDVINPLTMNALSKLKEITNNELPEVVIDATGSLKAMENAFQYIGQAGRFVLVGIQKEPIAFSHPDFHKREATLMSSRNATQKDFEHSINCLRKKLIRPTSYKLNYVHFSEVKDEFPKWLNAERPLKTMIIMD
ncbi:MAG: zinc-binding alcohol dehydrogenase family protein [Flavisolibacter sp.]